MNASKESDQRIWHCLQLGSREHYAIPRVLHSQGCLGQLITDTWILGGLAGPLGRIQPALAQRRHDGIPDRMVSSAGFGRVAMDLGFRILGTGDWDRILKRNDWFQNWAARLIRKGPGKAGDVLFSYSYTAAEPFREARRKGMVCVLGQIDPGPMEEVVVAKATAPYPDLTRASAGPPDEYWERWRQEVELADLILVNSEWSARLLRQGGVPAEKLRIIPLAYESSAPAPVPLEPARAGAEELKVLFLGQVISRKGIGPLIEAIRLMKDEPLRFIIAGPCAPGLPQDILENPQVELLGAVDREKTVSLYRSADVFLLPTFSDGFAITQLEAFAHGLPVIASRNCGAVVSHGIDGLLLEEVTPQAIVASLRRLIDEPGLQGRLKSVVKVPHRFSLESLGKSLHDLDFPLI